MRVLVCAGGTGGGIYPALAVVTELKALGIGNEALLWIGTKGEMEETLVPRAGLRLETISGGPIVGVPMVTRTKNAMKLARGYTAASTHLRRFQPDVMFMTGGYVAGKKTLVENSLIRLTAPGIGGHLGVTFNQNRLVFQELFLAPSVVSGAVKGAMLAASCLARLGLKVDPSPLARRFDIIQAIEFGNRQRLINFCRALQSYSPVNAHVAPEPSGMPGYDDEVIMAGGSFVEGATIELSADGPLREPYAAYLQGGLSYLHVKTALLGALNQCAAAAPSSFLP